MKTTRTRAFFLALRLALPGIGVLLGLGLVQPAAAQHNLVDDSGVINLYDPYCLAGGPDDGCNLESFAVIYDTTTGSSLDALDQTSVSLDSFDDGYNAFVCGYIYQDGAIYASGCIGDDGNGVAAVGGSVAISTANGPHQYTVLTDSYYDYYVNGGCESGGSCYFITSTQVAAWIGPPRVTSVSPAYVFVGTSGTITIGGQALVNPFGAGSTTVMAVPAVTGATGLTLSANAFTATQGTANDQATLTATTGPWDIGLGTQLGSTFYSSTTKGLFTVGDPTPSISSVNPNSWTAGQTNIPVTIKGSYFGSNPQLIIVGSGITSYSITSHVDNGQPNGAQIGANVSVFACALAGTATITVTSQGYNGSGFTPAYPGQSSSGTSTASIVATQTGLIGITGANLETNAVNITLSGTSCDTGSLDVTANGVSNHPQTAYNGGAPVGPGSYNVALNRPNMPADTYSSVTGDWNFSPTPAQTMFNLTKTWWVQGYTQHTQYNTPAESKCSTTQATAFIYNPSACTWSSALSMSKQFISQAELNGTGTADKSGHALLHAYGGQCKNYPSGASSSNSFYSISSVTGACNVALNGSSVATYPNPKAKGSKWNCNDDLLIVNSSNANVAIDKVLDYCPACSKWGPGYVAHVDHYSSSNACTLSSLPGNWAADTH
jgi:hypothetical protein